MGTARKNTAFGVLLGMLVMIGVVIAVPRSNVAHAQDEDTDAIHTTEDALTMDAASTPSEEYFSFPYDKGTVLRIVEEGEEELAEGFVQPFRTVEIRLDSGDRKGETVMVTQYGEGFEERGREFVPGDRVIVSMGEYGGELSYFIHDHYRLPTMGWFFALFLALAAAFAGIRGLTSVIGLAFSVGVLGLYVVPSIINGGDPLMVTIVAALLIAIFSVYFSHGVNIRTTIAIAAILLTMIAAALVASLLVSAAQLSGLGTEEAFYLQIGMQSVNLKGLLLGGILLGALGVLDDVVTAQVAAVDEIRKADPSLGFKELYRRGKSVGSEHIASLVNTLALAYVGSSLPLFLLFKMNATLPAWVIANGEIVTEEVVRTLAGSIALVLAVPVSTVLAAYVLSKLPPGTHGGHGLAGHRH